MSPIQQMLLGVGAVAEKTYVDDVFSTYLYVGNDSSNTITTNIDSSNNDSLLWIKNRNNAVQHQLFDTVRGANKVLQSNGTNAEYDGTGVFNQTFTSTGFTLNNTTSNTNSNNHTYTSWTFRKAPGFFDVVTYTGTGSARTVDHNLGCVPGMIIIKRLDTADNWNVYHRSQHSSNSPGYYLQLNTTDSIGGASNRWNDTAPTATQFTVGTAPVVNADGDEFIAYLFAGGESTASEAVSVDFDGTDDKLTLAATSDLVFGTGAYTVEFWIKFEGTESVIFSQYTDANGGFVINSSNNSISINLFGTGAIVTATIVAKKTWTHYAFVREGTGSNQTKIYENGILIKTGTDATDWNVSAISAIGGNAHPTSTQYTNCKISNFRIVKGTAVYTSSFRPPTEPLTNITNTKLLCCNNSSTTGSTVTPGTITAVSSPTASTDSPFDDPAGFVFGENEDQNVIKCGSYVGNGSSTGPEINLGWEPQWVLIKNASAAKSWKLLDSMRGIVTGDMEAEMQAENTNAEHTGADRIELTSTGFKLKTTSPIYNEDGDIYTFMCLRRSDGYVGKPPELGTDVFAMDTGASTSANTIPDLDSSFPVDLALIKNLTQSQDWHIGTRLQGTKKLNTNLSASESTSSNQVWDSNLGCWKNLGSEYQGWMWKRHAGFTVCIWEGDGVIGRQIPHDMNKIPEMIWLKKRTGTARNWPVYHKGLDGGSSPEEKVMWLNLTNTQSDAVESWNNTAPTSTHFTIHGTANEPNTNTDGEDYIAMLFASVDGISKVGSYTGNGSATSRTITLGFQPRFLILKNANGYNDWFVFDTVRGWASGNDTVLSINSDAVQYSGEDYGAPTSTGFTITSSLANVNENNSTYIYYAHA